MLIAFSGGVDSTFLLKVASTVLPGEKIIAVTADSETYPGKELLSAKETARSFGVRHKIIKTFEMRDKRFTRNPVNRCYFCKKELFAKLAVLARSLKLDFVADASNASDKQDFRPGNKAKDELKIRSPLQEAGISKKEIRSLSKKLGLLNWDKPAAACLASRVPYGTKITGALLARIDEAEGVLGRFGFKQARVRHYNGLCRIEVRKEDIPGLLRRRDLIVERFKKLGYNYVTVDLEGYRTGSLNEVIRK